MADQSSNNNDQDESMADTASTAFERLKLSEQGQFSNDGQQYTVSNNTRSVFQGHEASSVEADTATNDTQGSDDDIIKNLKRSFAERRRSSASSTSGTKPGYVRKDIKARRHAPSTSAGVTSASTSRVSRRPASRRSTSYGGNTAPQTGTTATNTSVGPSASQKPFFEGAPVEEEPEEMQVDQTEH